MVGHSLYVNKRQLQYTIGRSVIITYLLPLCLCLKALFHLKCYNLNFVPCNVFPHDLVVYVSSKSLWVTL